MWRQFALAYECIPAPAVALVQAIHALDTPHNYRVNAVVYGILEAGIWTPDEMNWRNWFRAQFELKFVVQIPPENSYFTLGRPLWDNIYARLDAGDVPSYDECWMLQFPASQGGAWPPLWP